MALVGTRGWRLKGFPFCSRVYVVCASIIHVGDEIVVHLRGDLREPKASSSIELNLSK